MVTFEQAKQREEQFRTRAEREFGGKKGDKQYNKWMNDYVNKRLPLDNNNQYTTGDSKHISENILRNGSKKDLSDYSARRNKDFIRESGKYTSGSGVQQGYGFGLTGSFKTGRLDDLKSLAFDTPMVAKESLMNSVGLMTKQQKLQMSSSGILGRVMGAAMPIGAMASIGMGMYDQEDPYEIMQQQLTTASTFTGGILGMRAGGVLAPVNSNGFIKGASRLTGFGIGAVAGGAIVHGAFSGVKDMLSAESTIGEFAHEASKRESLANIDNTQGTLTMRQRSLQQISSSVLNDRGFTLGNEASILKNVSL